MLIASWNVNSIRVRERLVLDWLARALPDIVCLQETKVVDDDFPTEELMRLGYAVAMSGQPSYNGVAIATRLPMKDIELGLSSQTQASSERRAISASIAGTRVINVYVPNGKLVGSPAFAEKLRFFEQLRLALDTSTRADEPVVVCGDFNVARDDRDVYAPELFRGKLHFHPDEQRALARVMDFGLVDTFRELNPDGGQFSWWDYRSGSFRKNEGLRIDYVLISNGLRPRLRRAYMDTAPRHANKPSDHVPVVIELSD